MNMISKIEVEDGIKSYLLLKQRIVAIIIKMREIEEMSTDGISDYGISYIHIPENDIARNGQEATVQVGMKLRENDESAFAVKMGFEDEEEFFDDISSLNRRYSFPKRYLTSDDWESEVESNHIRSKKYWNDVKIKQLKAAIERDEKSIEYMTAKLADMEAKTFE